MEWTPEPELSQWAKYWTQQPILTLRKEDTDERNGERKETVIKQEDWQELFQTGVLSGTATLNKKKQTDTNWTSCCGIVSSCLRCNMSCVVTMKLLFVLCNVVALLVWHCGPQHEGKKVTCCCFNTAMTETVCKNWLITKIRKCIEKLYV